jgi:hypothetical protein
MPFATEEQKREYHRLYYHKHKYKIKERVKKRECEHERIRSTCKECKGGSVCEHQRQSSHCKECKGGSVCEHQRQRSQCKECKGGSVCQHERIRSRCKECKGGHICEHQRERSHCKECLSVPEYLVLLQRSAMKRIFRHADLNKINASITYLGCSPQYFKEFIEKKMTAEMIWDNIHLDNIKPVSKFNLQDHDEFLDCCHYSNFQPLLVADNLEKFNKWNDEHEKFWNENIKGKEYLSLYKV